MMSRSTDLEAFMRVVHDPSVWDWVSLGAKEINLEAVIADSENVLLTNEHGGVLFLALPDGVYDAHTAFLPGGRGKLAINAGREAIKIMFESGKCSAISTFVADNNRPADWFTRKLGFKPFARGSALGVGGTVYILMLEDRSKISCQ